MLRRPTIFEYGVHLMRTLAARFAYKRDSGARIMALSGENAARYWPNLNKFYDQARTYGQSSWVYIAVDRKATAGALVNLNVFRLQGERKIGVINHPLEALLRRPNNWQTQFEFMFQTLGFLELTGNAYWFLNGLPDAPTELIVLRPDRVQVVPGTDTARPIAGYVYDVDGAKVPLAPEEIAHFTLFNPESDFYGLSRLEAAQLTVQTDLAMQQWNRNFFGKEKAVPLGVLSVKAGIGDFDYERIKDEWSSSYGGTERRTAILRGDVASWQEVGTTHREMDFGAGRQFNKEEIYQIFGIPPGLWEKNATEANALAAMELFTQNTVWPMMIALAQKVSVAIAPYFEPGLVVEPEDIRKKDAASDRAEIQTASAFLSINEVRQRFYNLEPKPWGDIPASGAGAVISTGQPVYRLDGALRPRELLPDSLSISMGEPSVNKSVQHELEQFARYAAKAHDPDRLDRFVFHMTPPAIAWTAKSLAGLDDLSGLQELIGDIAAGLETNSVEVEA